MTNRNKAKGSQFERDVVCHLRANGFPHAERAYGAGRPDDRGDIDGIPGVVIEAKNCARLELAKWIEEAERERANANAAYGVVVYKRRGHNAAKAYVTMTLDTFAAIMREGDA